MQNTHRQRQIWFQSEAEISTSSRGGHSQEPQTVGPWPVVQMFRKRDEKGWSSPIILTMFWPLHTHWFGESLCADCRPEIVARGCLCQVWYQVKQVVSCTIYTYCLVPARLWGKANLYIVCARWTYIYENMWMPQKFWKGEELFGQRQNRNGRKAFA